MAPMKRWRSRVGALRVAHILQRYIHFNFIDDDACFQKIQSTAACCLSLSLLRITVQHRPDMDG